MNATTSKYREPAREIPYLAEADVVVAGGGMAGLCAAVAAARNGASTLLVERTGVLGGTATTGLMTSFNGFRNERPPNTLQTVRGLGEEVVHRLMNIGAASGRTAHGDFGTLEKGNLPYAVGFDPEGLKRVALQMCVEAGVRLLLFTWVADVMRHSSRVTGVIVESKSGRRAVGAKIVVDATGDGDVAASAGAEYQIADPEDPHLMALTLMLRLAGVRPERFRGNHLAIGQTATLWGPGVSGVRADDVEGLTAAQAEAMRRVTALVENLRSEPGFEAAYLVQTADHIGVREGRLIRGLYTVTEEDAKAGRRFDDTIAISSNPVPGYYGERYFFDHEGFDIPYRAIVPKGVDGLILAGRCISCEQVPFQSARSMAPLMAHSQASGTAAAMCAAGDCEPRHLDVPALQTRLEEQGAVLRRSTT
ncbi:MAG: FAD-dependent oxidoreductase [Phycisphaerae bacterium]